ncbi:uncharacterized protein LY89DRAFT_359859 [Mollisia scopiformis]|uniref:RBR-type E3 ubiquitin transferase n=1 Tax=Mollisia scopiformis TaxID=149040 RepID=A0A132B7G7_MOLSC|nr:uncharacterized protein LY89DRAFT_359859 [Mollisia scopiformis]KUJ07627.1 hypothetical protein LY89DRAFT_359859 [Mollisia scopiformis]
MTAAWHGFIHSWHTLAIILKWMCITIVGIPFAIIICVAIGLCAIAFAALCLASLILALMMVYYTFKAIFILLTRPPTWIREFRIARAERELMRLPLVNVRAPLEQRVLQTVPRGYFQTAPNTPLLPPPNTHLPFQAMVQISPPPMAHIGQAMSTNVASPITSLPRIIECQVCLDEKLPEQFPPRNPTDNCFHETTDCCRECLARSITSSFESNVWNDIRCPICNLRLEHKDIAEFATPETFRRYDDLSTRQALESEIPNFRWCLGPGCSFGQEHPDDPTKQPLATCSACGFSSCSFHNVPWHVGQTCEQYGENIITNPTEEDKKTEKIIKRLAKRCPGCKRYITKVGGCQHMSCPCGKQFCWTCLHNYPGHTWGCTRR